MILDSLFDDMVWSYSRINSFEFCPYGFYLRYVSQSSEEDMFYSSYGSFMHKLIERFYKGEYADRSEMLDEFLAGFSESVKGFRPSESIVQKYIQCGIEYINTFEPFDCTTVAVERRVEFEIEGVRFVGVIDYIGEKDGNYILIDNKSRDLKPRSNRAKPTIKDKELDTMLKQLYLYSTYIKQEYGTFPVELRFNCFKNRCLIKEKFDVEKYKEAVEWAKTTIEQIKKTDDFYPSLDFFKCRYLCGVNAECVYHQMSSERNL